MKAWLGVVTQGCRSEPILMYLGKIRTNFRTPFPITLYKKARSCIISIVASIYCASKLLPEDVDAEMKQKARYCIVVGRVHPATPKSDNIRCDPRGHLSILDFSQMYRLFRVFSEV